MVRTFPIYAVSATAFVLLSLQTKSECCWGIPAWTKAARGWRTSSTETISRPNRRLASHPAITRTFRSNVGTA